MQKKLEFEIPIYLKSLAFLQPALPPLWPADSIPVKGHTSPMVIGEINCSCLDLAGSTCAAGISKIAQMTTVAWARRWRTSLVRRLSSPSSWRRRPRPSTHRCSPTRPGAMLVSLCRHTRSSGSLCVPLPSTHPQGGSGKLVNGHSIDTVAIVNGLISGGIAGASSFTM